MSGSQILVVNCGSSSLKFALYQPSNTGYVLLAQGLAEGLNQDEGHISYKTSSSKNSFSIELIDGKPHGRALEKVLELLEVDFSLSKNLSGIGHRVVHGGKLFKQSVRVTDQVLSQIKSCIPLAPLHNPANVIGIESLQSLFPTLPQVAVFDTSFHQTLPEKAFLYGLPYSLYRNNDVRKYGFHGTSHRCISEKLALQLGKPKEEFEFICAHLGNGASVAAISKGISLDTSMGMTPLEGLVMGTRSGDIDPGIFDYLISLGHSSSDISKMLNKESGLLGLSELSNDMRTICEEADNGHKGAKAALDVFCFRAAKHIAAMAVSLGNLDALVFTGGIGENSARVRHDICLHLAVLGINLDETANNSPQKSKDNNKPGTLISTANSKVVYIIPTDEEAMIVKDTLELIS